MKSLSHRFSLNKVREKIRSLSSRFFCVMKKQKACQLTWITSKHLWIHYGSTENRGTSSPAVGLRQRNCAANVASRRSATYNIRSAWVAWRAVEDPVEGCEERDGWNKQATLYDGKKREVSEYFSFFCLPVCKRFGRFIFCFRNNHNKYEAHEFKDQSPRLGL